MQNCEKGTLLCILCCLFALLGVSWRLAMAHKTIDDASFVNHSAQPCARVHRHEVSDARRARSRFFISNIVSGDWPKKTRWETSLIVGLCVTSSLPFACFAQPSHPFVHTFPYLVCMDHIVCLGLFAHTNCLATLSSQCLAHSGADGRCAQPPVLSKRGECEHFLYKV